MLCQAQSRSVTSGTNPHSLSVAQRNRALKNYQLGLTNETLSES
jgi:hypothetical protein